MVKIILSEYVKQTTRKIKLLKSLFWFSIVAATIMGLIAVNVAVKSDDCKYMLNAYAQEMSRLNKENINLSEHIKTGEEYVIPAECMVISDKQVIQGVFSEYNNTRYCCTVGVPGLSCLEIPE